MNIIIDDGNSRTKVAVFEKEGDDLQPEVFESAEALKSALQKEAFEHVLVSSVKGRAEEIHSWISSEGKKLILTSSLSLPIKIGYETPETLGVDRIAAAVGAVGLFPNKNCLVIDAGTCITYDFVTSDSLYLGGAISPGLRMRFEAMHKLTARLPLAVPVESPKLVGTSTLESLQSGVVNGIAEEIKGIIARYRSQFPDLCVVMCGGDAGFFENIGKGSIFVAPDLVLHGLRGILIHHVP